MWEFGEELVKKWISRLASDCLVIADPRNKPYEKHMLEFEESMTGWISWLIRDSSQGLSDPRNSLLDCFLSLTFPILYQHYINSHYPRNVRRRSIHKKLLREKTLAKHLRVKDCLPTILYIISLKFTFTPTSPSTHPWEVLSPNTYLTHFECWEKFWCLWEVLEEAIKWRMQSSGIVGSG